jgi:hypothetical protein
MKTTIPLRGLPRGVAIVAALMFATGAVAQNRGGALYGPFTDAEAQFLSAAWPEIRKAPDYEYIQWPAYGLAEAPGNRETQRLMAANWGELRGAARFEQIDWEDLIEDRAVQTSRYRSNERFEREFPGPFTGYGPFTRDEAGILSSVWTEIREAAQFNDIQWRAYGLPRAPGTADARRILADNWDEARRQRRFEDIDWDEIVADRELRTSRQYAGGFAGDASGLFTRDDAAALSRVWGQIRVAAEFDDIDWRAAGLLRAPGSSEARRIMSTNWGTLREAARFEDIDWAAMTGQPRRVLR